MNGLEHGDQRRTPRTPEEQKRRLERAKRREGRKQDKRGATTLRKTTKRGWGNANRSPKTGVGTGYGETMDGRSPPKETEDCEGPVRGKGLESALESKKRRSDKENRQGRTGDRKADKEIPGLENRRSHNRLQKTRE